MNKKTEIIGWQQWAVVIYPPTLQQEWTSALWWQWQDLPLVISPCHPVVSGNSLVILGRRGPSAVTVTIMGLRGPFIVAVILVTADYSAATFFPLLPLIRLGGV